MNFHELADLAGGKLGVIDTTCPLCSHRRRRQNQRKRVLRLWCDTDAITFCCVHCGAKGYALADNPHKLTQADRERHQQRRVEAVRRQADYDETQHRKALWLWQQSRPAEGTIVEAYLTARGLKLECLPATLRFLPMTKPEYHPAMIAPFGIPEEPEPGHLAIDDGAVRGVHLTLLKPDGSGKADIEPNKIMIGRSTGWPIVLAPMNDLLGLAIAEGIENALTAHQSNGFGAWAAGAAGRLPALADVVPDFVNCITIAVDDDEAGRANSRELARRLFDRGLRVETNLSALKDIAA
jgi:Toprim domain